MFLLILLLAIFAIFGGGVTLALVGALLCGRV